jgi:ATP-binding cassette subfamily B protein
VAIARALHAGPAYPDLDDSTSSVDVTTEFHIQQALDRLMKDRTSFVIAQRILHRGQRRSDSGARSRADRGLGKHEDLLESSEIIRGDLQLATGGRQGTGSG